jgi:hypothetical protein
MNSCWIVCATAMLVAGAQNTQKPEPRDAASAQTNVAASASTTHKRVHANLSGFDLDFKGTATDVGVEIGGGARGILPGLILFAPRRGRCYTTTPTFYWGQAEDFKKFRFTVNDADDDVIYESVVQGTSFRYPATAPALEPGKTYSWTVQREGTLMAGPAAPVEFVMLPEAERKAVQEKLKALPGESRKERIRRVEIWVNARLWYDAIEAYTALILQYPDDADLYNARGEIYYQIAATRELAEKDFSRADDEQAHQKKK